MKKEILIHALRVLGHIVIASFAVGLAVLIDNKPEISQQFAQGLVDFGIPVAIANVVIASGIKYLQLKAAELQE